MREFSRSILHSADAKADSKSVGPETDSQSQAKAAQAKAIAAVRRPAWALSEEQANTNAEAKEREEEDELLDFAKSLDYDKFISDMEVKIMVEKLRERIMVRHCVLCVHP